CSLVDMTGVRIRADVCFADECERAPRVDLVGGIFRLVLRFAGPISSTPSRGLVRDERVVDGLEVVFECPELLFDRGKTEDTLILGCGITNEFEARTQC